ncbi:MAG TPA: sulfite exporter TauE/SafE family protein [Gemmatimonadaceae bacterium]|nr:sulfite exporter TauE/SafE family protein [Gemmatimonadaceae bacterium]
MIGIFIGIGLAAGVLAGMFGIGGGIVIVPALIILAKMSATSATGTSLGALLLPVGALGAWEYWRHGHVNVRAALLIALGLFLGAWFGARLAIQLPPQVLRRSFAVFLLVVAVRLWVKGS